MRTGRRLAPDVRNFLSGLKIVQGPLAGQLFDVLPYQRRFLRGALAAGAVESVLAVGRGAGKSTVVAGVGCAALEGPLMVPGADVLVVASSFDQGLVIFRHVLGFGRYVDRRGFRVVNTSGVALVENQATGTRLQVMGASPGALHGKAPSLIVCDELAQWAQHKIDPMLAALRTSMGKVGPSRMWMIGTRAAHGAHPFELAIRTADYAQVHAARPGDPLGHKRTWARANPAVEHFPDLLEATRREWAKAQKDPAHLASFKALRLNMGVSDVVSSVLIEPERWVATEGEAAAGGQPVWGIDLGGSSASSAVAAYWPTTGRLECLSAFPGHPGFAERGLMDGVGRLYVAAAERGELLALGYRAVPYHELFRKAAERFGRPAAIACDRWREKELRDALDLAGIPPCRLDVRGQGYKDGGEDVRAFRRAVAEDKVTPVPSLYLTAAIGEARTVMDAAGNSKLAKNSQGGRRVRARDDAAAAAILAVALATRKPGRKRSVYRGKVAASG